MAKKNETQKQELESKLEGLKQKLAALRTRGAGWGKAIRRTEIFIQQVEDELSKIGKVSKPDKADLDKSETNK